MRITIINGPNLNLLGEREPSVYGSRSFESYLEELTGLFPLVEFEYFQSNVEGELINALHACRNTTDGIILNAGGYTHTSVSIADAIAAVRIPVIEVHLSSIYAREEFRQQSLTARQCAGVISGFGLTSYRLAVEAFIERFTAAD
ncbi:MAG: type 3-dehydroquinate dehydratase [Bacteroidota bacterium]